MERRKNVIKVGFAILKLKIRSSDVGLKVGLKVGKNVGKKVGCSSGPDSNNPGKCTVGPSSFLLTFSPDIFGGARWEVYCRSIHPLFLVPNTAEKSKTFRGGPTRRGESLPTTQGAPQGLHSS